MTALLVIGVLTLILAAGVWIFLAFAYGMSDNPEASAPSWPSLILLGIGIALLVLRWWLKT